MRLVHLEDVEPGMVTARAVLDEKGAVLVKEGTEITEELLGRLESRKVKAVWVGSGEDEPPADSGEREMALKKRLAVTFKGTLDDEIMAHIAKAVYKHEMKKLES